MNPRALSILLASALGSTIAVPTAHATCSAGTPLANVAETAPNGEFASLADGFVLHMKTRLVWKRCVEGQSWNGTGCSGEPSLADWGSALNLSVAANDGGTNQWRVPNRKELESIVEFCGHGPAINTLLFPTSPADRFWTSTTFQAEPTRAWDVYFADGYVGASNKSTPQYVRLVRSMVPSDLPLQQTITIGEMPNLVVGATATLLATASSGLPLVFSTLNAGVCTITGNAVTALAAGVCSIEARQGGDEFFVEAAQSFDLPVDKRAQTITFGTAPSLAAKETVAVAATASSGLPVTLSSGTPAVCSASGLMVTGLSGGTCTLLANQAGDDVYQPAPTASLNLTVSGPTVTDPGGGTTTPGSISFSMRLGAGWHLLGNSLNAPIDVASKFADRRIVESVWKWNAETQRWAFFTPQFNQQALASYTKSRSLDVLAAVGPGEGYWIKLKQEHDFGEQKGEPVVANLKDLRDGWHLVTLGKAMRPAELNSALAEAGAATSPSGGQDNGVASADLGPASAAPPAPGESPAPIAGNVPQSFVSLWSWENAKGRMLFYSPALEAQGPEAVKAYLDAKGYLDFDAENQLVGEGRGFWIRIKK